MVPVGESDRLVRACADLVVTRPRFGIGSGKGRRIGDHQVLLDVGASATEPADRRYRDGELTAPTLNSLSFPTGRTPVIPYGTNIRFGPVQCH
jgi:hypothetical protein